MRFLVFCFAAILSSQCAHADFIFKVTQRDAGPIQLGDKVIFDVTVATGPTVGTITNLGGITFFLGADDPTFSGNATTAGLWSDGTIDSSSQLAAGRTYLFTPDDGVGYLNKPVTPADRSSLIAYSSFKDNGRTLSSAGALLGSFVLDTKDATLGDHTFTFDQLDAVNPSGVPLAGPFTGLPTRFTITAVPEPSSLVLTGIALACAAFKLRKKRSHVSVPV